MFGLDLFRRKAPPTHSGRGATVYAFPAPASPHWATVKDRVRNSGLTSVRFVSDTTLVAADFACKACYFVRLDGNEMVILDRHDTVIADGSPVETDLIDYHDGAFIVSNFYQGTFSRYALENGRIRFLGEVDAGGPPNLHGLRYVPGHPNLVWLTWCNARRPCHGIFDTGSGKLLHVFDTDQQCQDVAFVDGHAVVFARTDHITKGAEVSAARRRALRMFATAYVYRLPDDLMRAPPVLVSRWTGEGHLDAAKETADGRILCANQYLDRVDIFRVSGAGVLSLVAVIDGFQLPHGLDIAGGRIAVSNYGDQSLRLMDLPSARQ